ncbi:MAG: HAD hydrolase-like protein, partial [Candidatus Marinimicrobia bacterium]|nr:HAD hydrolase-like protein [Candidatus Neomarinimicrobiota bacterium]
KCRQQFSEDYRPEQVVIIGDTVRDVWCAHRNGMRAVAVVRHADRRTAIVAENPDLIVDHFEDITPIIGYLNSLI